MCSHVTNLIEAENFCVVRISIPLISHSGKIRRKILYRQKRKCFYLTDHCSEYIWISIRQIWQQHRHTQIHTRTHTCTLLKYISTRNTFCETWYLPHSHVHNERTVPIIPEMHGACTKRLYFHFRSKIWRYYRVPRPQFPKSRENFGDSRTFKADLHGFSGPLGLKWGFGGQNRGRGGAILTP